MKISDIVDDATAREWARRQWGNPQYVASLITEAQEEALACLLAQPAWSAGIPASIFANDDEKALVRIFTHISREQRPGLELLKALEARKSVDERDLMWIWCWASWPWRDYANTRIRLDHRLGQLKKIFSWQYRQIKARRLAQ